MYFLLFLLFLNVAFSSYTTENTLIMLPNKKEVLGVCNKKPDIIVSNQTAIAIKSTNIGLTDIKDSFTLIALLENGQFIKPFNSRLASISKISDVFLINSNKKTPISIGLGMDHYAEGHCYEVIIPKDRTFFNATLISNKPNILLNTNVSESTLKEFIKNHLESCENSYCTDKKNECSFSCLKPYKIIATSDLDKNGIMEYWLDSIIYGKKVNYVIELVKDKDSKKWNRVIIGAQVFPAD